MNTTSSEPIDSTATLVDSHGLPLATTIPAMPAVQQPRAMTEADAGPSSVMSAILRVASDPNMDVTKMERLMAMHERLSQQQAEREFNSAMSRVQQNMRRIETDKRNAQTKSDYASYGQLDRALRPLYTEHGFALSFTTEPAGDAVVRVVCFVSHEAGFTRRYEIDMPADGKGAKGNDVMTKTHATGSATQYGMRYLLKLIFNVAIGADDDDGNGAGTTETVEPNSAQDWINRADALRKPEDYQPLREALAAHYKSVAAIPADVRTAFNRAKAELAQSIDTGAQA